MRAKAVLVVGLLLVVSLPPAALGQGGGQTQGGTDEVTFYGHIFNAGLFGPSPANTQPPIGEDNFGLGFGVNCQDVGPALPGVPIAMDDWESCEDEEANKLVLFSTAGPVDVQNRAEFQQKGGYAQLHNERGQTKDVQLDTSGTVTASVFGTWDTHGWLVGFPNPYGTNCVPPHPQGVPCIYPYWGWDPGVYEDVVMEATLYHADLGERSNASQAPPIQDVLENDEATVVAEGQWGPEQVMNGLPGAPNAFHWEVDLGAPQVDTIPKSDDFFLVFNTYQDASGNTFCYDCPMRWWSGEFFPPKFQMPVENAFTVERTIPNFANGQLAVLGIINTPWGSYDVDQDTVELEIEGPRGTVTPDAIERYSDFSVAHGGHFDPVNVTWIWDYRADDAMPGEYEVTVSAQNAQKSAASTCRASFVIQETDESLRSGGVEEGICGTQSELADEKAQEAREGVEEQTDE